MDRRSFVKTCVGVAGAGALAAAGLGIAAGTAIPRKAGGALIRYFGAHRVAGPAPRGVPYIPVTVENGVFVGKPILQAPDGTEINALDWYKYCGHSGAPGLKPDFTNDNTLTYFEKEDYKTLTPWFKDHYDQPIRPEHFPDVGFGAAFVWRSKGQSGAAILSGVLIKAPPSEVRYVASAVSPAKPLKDQAEYDWVRKNVFHENFIAVSTFCTHFCCVPGYREAEKLARPRNAWDNMFCTCHNSNYNYREPVAYTFSPEVAGEAGGFDPLLTRGGGGGGH